MKEKAITAPMNSATPLPINAALQAGHKSGPGRRILAGVNSERSAQNSDTKSGAEHARRVEYTGGRTRPFGRQGGDCDAVDGRRIEAEPHTDNQ